MTVAEIKEYIIEQIKELQKDKYIYNYMGDVVGELKGFRKTEKALYEIKSMLDQLDNESKLLYKSATNMTPQRAKEWLETIRDDRMSVADDDEFCLDDISALDYVIGLLDYIKE